MALFLLGIFVPSWIFGRAAAGAWIVPPAITRYVRGWIMPAAIFLMMLWVAFWAIAAGRA